MIEKEKINRVFVFTIYGRTGSTALCQHYSDFYQLPNLGEAFHLKIRNVSSPFHRIEWRPFHPQKQFQFNEFNECKKYNIKNFNDIVNLKNYVVKLWPECWQKFTQQQKEYFINIAKQKDTQVTLSYRENVAEQLVSNSILYVLMNNITSEKIVKNEAINQSIDHQTNEITSQQIKIVESRINYFYDLLKSNIDYMNNFILNTINITNTFEYNNLYAINTIPKRSGIMKNKQNNNYLTVLENVKQRSDLKHKMIYEDNQIKLI